MSIRSTNPALAGIKRVVDPSASTFDPNGMGENMATLARANAEEDQYYRNALANADPGVESAAIMQQQGGTMMEDPGMKAFLQQLHEKNATVGKSFIGTDPMAYSPGGMRSAAMDALYDVANKKSKAAGLPELK